RFLARHGAEIRVTDVQDETSLAGALAELKDLPIQYTLGRHDEADFTWAEIVVRNPGVPRESSWLELARRSGAQVEMEMTLFFRFCRAPIIGVTGTKGKTTTSAIISSILRQRWPDAVMAGNMGRTALGQLDNVRPQEPVVLEISSFQLEALDEQGLSPHVAVLTNISEDHLDRYPSFDDYADVKASIYRHQRASDWAVYPRDDALLGDRLRSVEGQPATFGISVTDADHALWVENDRFAGRWGGSKVDLGPVNNLPIPGNHSRLNALAACAATLAAGVAPDEIRAGLSAAEPVPNRLELIATVDGVDYINDTTATTPAATVAALGAFGDREIIAIAGGSEKRVSLVPLADSLVRRAGRVVLLDGKATPGLLNLLRERGYDTIDGPAGSMDEAVRLASQAAGAGSVVLLSPGCASFGMFRNEFHRGDAFREAVARLKDKVDS
ncbi:MAG TPA: UDP-N-acetylmuramoyl-L-alanine--D-glutamate ligase, partial [Thermomicrobiales bacterium]|nr:UDP-N-acetylmuramoyl-L-alanine--D-glutamate ligase [Thermomicrobiales bacterium]